MSQNKDNKIEITFFDPSTNSKSCMRVDPDKPLGDLEFTVNGKTYKVSEQLEEGAIATTVNGQAADADHQLKDGDQVAAAPAKVGMAA